MGDSAEVTREGATGAAGAESPSATVPSSLGSTCSALRVCAAFSRPGVLSIHAAPSIMAPAASQDHPLA
jgi:hypothetical protein